MLTGQPVSSGQVYTNTIIRFAEPPVNTSHSGPIVPPRLTSIRTITPPHHLVLCSVHVLCSMFCGFSVKKRSNCVVVQLYRTQRRRRRKTVAILQWYTWWYTIVASYCPNQSLKLFVQHLASTNYRLSFELTAIAAAIARPASGAFHHLLPSHP